MISRCFITRGRLVASLLCLSTLVPGIPPPALSDGNRPRSEAVWNPGDDSEDLLDESPMPQEWLDPTSERQPFRHGDPGLFPRWIELPPPARSEHVAVFDPTGNRMFVFGGRVSGGGYRNDVWILNLRGTIGWNKRAVRGETPSPRVGSAGVYDPSSARLILMGGQDSTGYRNDVWELTLRGRPRWR